MLLSIAGHLVSLSSTAQTLPNMPLLLSTNSWWVQTLTGFVCARTWIILFFHCQKNVPQREKHEQVRKKTKKMSNEEGWSCCALSFDIFPKFRDCRSTQKGKINLFPSKCLSSRGVQSWLQAYAHACTHNYSTCGWGQFPKKLLLSRQWWESRVQLWCSWVLPGGSWSWGTGLSWSRSWCGHCNKQEWMCRPASSSDPLEKHSSRRYSWLQYSEYDLKTRTYCWRCVWGAWPFLHQKLAIKLGIIRFFPVVLDEPLQPNAYSFFL